MADDIDKAQDREAENLQDALAAQRLKASATQKLIPQGCCLNPHCAEPFEAANDNARLFCNDTCAREHRRLARI
ncbi:MAG: hypothetical protein ACTHKN_08875 [Achromobacter mucicolens]